MKKLGFLITFIALIGLYSKPIYAQHAITPAPPLNEIISDGWVPNSFSVIFGSTIGYHTKNVGWRYEPVNSHYLCQVDVSIKRVGSPSDFLKLNVYEDGSGLTNGTLLTDTGGYLVEGASISDTAQEVVSFPLNTCVAINKVHHYWIVVSRTIANGEEGDGNYYYFYTQNTGTIPADETQFWTDFGYQSTYQMYGRLWGIEDGQAIDNAEENSSDNVCNSVPDFVKPFCEATFSLVFPDSAKMTADIDDFKTTLQAKAPFAYIEAVFSLNLDNPASGSALPIISVPINNTVTLPNTEPITFNATVPESARGAFDWIRNFTSLLIWISFIIWLVHLARRII